MELDQFASSPSEPTWEPPRWRALHVHQIRIAHNAANDKDSNDLAEQAGHQFSLNERAQVLDDIASEFNTLCATNAPLEDVKSHLERWTDHTSPGRVQANVLAWLDDTNVMRLACTNNNIALVRLLLATGLAVQPTAVTFAIAQLRETGNDELVRLLLQGGWDINRCLNENTPPLLSQVMEFPELVMMCLALGADPNVSSPSGRLIMESAASVASLHTLESLVNHGARVEDGALVAHASYAHCEGQQSRVDIARYLLDRGAPVDAFYLNNHKQDSCHVVLFGRQNALHFALWGGQKDMVALLLERGADKSIPTCSALKTDGQLMSPAKLALKYGHKDLVALL